MTDKALTKASSQGLADLRDAAERGSVEAMLEVLEARVRAGRVGPFSGG